ncbi:MAG: hypothetical protein ACI4A7_08795 [Prevotella sp.]
MKKLCLLALALFFTASTWGQSVQGYGFEVTQEEYHPLGDDAVTLDFSTVVNLSETVFTHSDVVTTENTDVQGIDLGFTVKYNGVDCDHFVIYGIGAVQLGGETISVFPKSGTSLINNGQVNALLCYTAGDVSPTENTRICYKVSGEAPNRMLTVEYRQFGVKTSGGREIEITYLICIKENGTVSYCFEEFDAGEDYLDFYIGLCGNKGECLTLGGEDIEVGKQSFNANTTSINKIPGGKTVTLTPQSTIGTGLSTPVAPDFTVKGNDGYVNILNGSSEMMEFVEVYDAAGQLVRRVEVGSTGNVTVPVGRKHGLYVVTIGLARKTVAYNVVL